MATKKTAEKTTAKKSTNKKKVEKVTKSASKEKEISDKPKSANKKSDKATKDLELEKSVFNFKIEYFGKKITQQQRIQHCRLPGHNPYAEAIVTAFEKLSDGLKRDKELVLATLNVAGYYSSKIYEFIPNELQIDRDIVIAATKNGSTLELFDKKFQGDRDVVLSAVSNGGRV